MNDIEKSSTLNSEEHETLNITNSANASEIVMENSSPVPDTVWKVNNVIMELECEPNCTVCDNFIMQLSQHIRETHTKRQELNIQHETHTDDSFQTSQVEVDIEISSDDFLYCEICGERFSQPDDFQIHVENHDDIEIPTFETSVCDIHELSQVTETAEDVQIEDYIEISPALTVTIVSSEHPVYHSDLDPEHDQVGSVFTIVKERSVHIPKIPKPRPKHILEPKIKECCICEKKGFDTRQLNRHIQKAHPGENPYICKVCDTGFPTRFKLDQHCRTHPGEKTYFCDFGSCNKGFSFKAGLIGHMKKHYTTKSSQVCDVCDKSFTRAGLLIIHKRTHMGEKPFICEICSDSFWAESTLKKHMKVHEGNNPRNCSLCGSTFYSCQQLNRHVRAVHPEHKRHLCTFCGKSYVKHSDLRDHLRNHTGERPHVCTICNRGFTKKRLLAGHLITHTGEKPHVCEMCKKGYHQKSGLEIHMRTHTGEKPFTCETCGKTFHNNGILIGHRRTHTKEKPYVCKYCNKGFAQSNILQTHLVSHGDGQNQTKKAKPRSRNGKKDSTPS